MRSSINPIRALALSAALLAAIASPSFAAGSHAGGHGEEMMAAGKPGEMKNVRKTIVVSMMENADGAMVFDPSEIKVKQGQTVRFVIKNTGEFDHEFVLDNHANVMEHKALMEKFPEMEHDDPNAIRLAPGETGEIIWTFANEGDFEFACLIPGHYDLGMHGPLSVAH
ncbi:cupredoxin domain-containing protein [Kordiimonas sp.]|uniref:cupredoxin domain-containing protein n=1 Tax=Kordiimonas sp. TaxID=1970157 RepID=UPI003A8CBA84